MMDLMYCRLRSPASLRKRIVWGPWLYELCLRKKRRQAVRFIVLQRSLCPRLRLAFASASLTKTIHEKIHVPPSSTPTPFIQRSNNESNSAACIRSGALASWFLQTLFVTHKRSFTKAMPRSRSSLSCISSSAEYRSRRHARLLSLTSMFKDATSSSASFWFLAWRTLACFFSAFISK